MRNVSGPVVSETSTDKSRDKGLYLHVAWDPTVSYHLFVNIMCNN